MQKIKLTRKKIALVDDEDFEYLKQYHWNTTTNGYAARRDGKKSVILMHRVIMKAPKNKIIDHINRDKLNNQKSNLRIVTYRENLWNTKPHKNNISKLKGVRWHLKNKKWQSRICINKKDTHIGYFNTKEDAAMAYDFFVLQFFDKYSYTNFGRKQINLYD